MLFVFGNYQKNIEIKRIEFISDNCPKCNKPLKVMEAGRYFSFMYLIHFKIKTIGYFYFCPECNAEYLQKNLKQNDNI
jgi:hypothetical protein